MSLALFFAVCLVASGIAIRMGMALSSRFGVMDHPGGHKQHDASTPFIGGVGILVVLAGALFLAEYYFPGSRLHLVRPMLLGACLLFATGLADDIWALSFRSRFLVQGVVAISMIIQGNVELLSLGELAPGVSIELGALGVPFTIFATVGLINALNMIDGIDGLSGSMSLISLGFVALVAGMGGNDLYLVLAIALMGGVAGFLYFNLRYPYNGRARVFLGDNGSMVLGFVFAWLFIALSQGEARSMPPVTALWLFAVPLMDTVGVMLRRLRHRKSPFHPDRNHLHHLFLRAGFRVSDTVWTIAAIQVALGAVGVAGLLLRVPDYAMFGLFLATFAAYFYAIVRPWRFVPTLRRINVALGLPHVSASGIFVGHFPEAACGEIRQRLQARLKGLQDYRLSFHRMDNPPRGESNVFAVVDVGEALDEAGIGRVRRHMAAIRQELDGRDGIRVRLFMRRSSDNDRRVGQRAGSGLCAREGDRRVPDGVTEIHAVSCQGAEE